MLRLALLNLVVIGLMLLAVRRWYWALCGLLFLTVFSQHPSMPTNMLGIQGLNPWNATLAVIIVFWFINRRDDPDAQPLPGAAFVLIGAYLVVVIGSTVAAAADADSVHWVFTRRSTQWLFVNGTVNPLKYLVVGLLFMDGARTRQRVRFALFSAIGSALLYSLLMFKSMKHGVFTIDFEDARRMTDKLIGLYANDLAELLAFALWGALCLTMLLKERWHKGAWLLIVLASVPTFISLKSRAGFLAFCVAGLVLGALRWRRILIAFPVVVLITTAAVPSVRERALAGLAAEETGADWDEVSAGRITNIWPPVIEQIAESPIIGNGRFAILRKECHAKILAAERSLPTHPHNSYLEILLDAGLIGLLVCLLLMAAIVRAGWHLMRQDDPLFKTLGTVALIAVVTELSAGVAGSSFFPTQSAVPYLCIWGAAYRAHLELRAAEIAQPAPAVVSIRPLRTIEMRPISAGVTA